MRSAGQVQVEEPWAVTLEPFESGKTTSGLYQTQTGKMCSIVHNVIYIIVILTAETITYDVTISEARRKWLEPSILSKQSFGPIVALLWYYQAPDRLTIGT